MKLTAHGLHIDYPLRDGTVIRALEQIDLCIEPGTITALLGPNGSGKSSLLLALCGLLPPNRGCVTFGEKPLASFSASERAAHFGCLFQDESVAFDFTVRELVGLGSSAQPRADVDVALARLHLEQLAPRRWSTLSGGQQQRAQLARALVAAAPILVLDEPFNHLDLYTRAILLDLLDEERREGRAVIFSTHDLEAASRADRVLLLDRGHSVAFGGPPWVLTPERIAEVFHVRVVPFNTDGDGRPFLRLESPLLPNNS